MFSQWLWLTGIEDKEAATVADALYKTVYLDLAGFPAILRSDNGFEFVGEVTKELNRLVGTTQIFGSAYHPRSQALIEGSHKPLESILQAFASEWPDDWADQLPIARWSWNTTPKQGLGGLSPYYVVTGLVPKNPLSQISPAPTVCACVSRVAKSAAGARGRLWPAIKP